MPGPGSAHGSGPGGHGSGVDHDPAVPTQRPEHRLLADVQVVIAGTEWFGYAPLSDQPIHTPYDADRDILFVRGDTSLFRLSAGAFAVFFPHDAHLPSRTLTTPERVRKIVIKIQMPPSA